MSDDLSVRPIVVRGTEIRAGADPRSYREKIARVTLDSMVQFVGLLDANGTVLEINKVALDAVGIVLADVQGRPFWTTFWWQVSDEINDELREMIRRAAAGEFVRWDTAIYGRAGGKESIIIDASLMPVKDDDGQVVFICAEGRDITEKKAREAEVAQKNIELQGLLERIRELDEIKTQFFANVSHELRTPLALILGPAQRLIDDDGTMDAAQRRDGAQVIARNARMLLKHVNDLLDMSKLEAGKLKIEPQRTDLPALVRFLASHFAVLASERRIEFVVDANDAFVGAVDPDKLQRVVMNLLANAFKFTPDSGRILCSVRRSGDDVIIAVDDSGPGVPSALRKAIFERFRQADGGSNRKAAGTGLGLAIAKEFVEMHRGRILVHDSELGGARFEVTLPVPCVTEPGTRSLEPGTLEPGTVEPGTGEPGTSPDSGVSRELIDGVLEELRTFEAPRPSPEPARAAAGRPRVLVVEDNRDMNRFVSRALSQDYDVVSAFDGREGLEKALHLRPALIVTDLMMPNVSGDEMIAEIRRQPQLHLTPILLLSAKADEDLMVRLLDDGAQDFIVKPFSERDLVVRVRNLIHVNALREAAEGANRAKDEFLAMLGHELRNPLSPILTALQLMKVRGAEDSERARTVIERQVNHLTRLVDDLLDVSRIARGRIELKEQVVEIGEVVAKAIETTSPLLEQQTHVLTVDVPESGLSVYADPTRLSQVISNLLTNAAKYTPAGGRIDVGARREGDEVVVSVRDSGIGIPPAMLPHVFDLFVQARQAIDRSQGGLGLGLTIVRNLVEQHGGTVSAKSDGPGLGSEFTIRLPMAAGKKAAHQAGGAAPSATARGEAGRVLIVDDNIDAAEMFAYALRHQGYETRIAHDGPAALQIAADFKPTVAVLDIGLPVMDGYELARHLRQIPHLANVRLIAVTGYGQDSDRRRAHAVGFHKHLVKPVDLDDMEAAIRGSNQQDA